MSDRDDTPVFHVNGPAWDPGTESLGDYIRRMMAFADQSGAAAITFDVFALRVITRPYRRNLL